MRRIEPAKLDDQVLVSRPKAAAVGVGMGLATLVSGLFASAGVYAVLSGKSEPVTGIIIGLFAPMSIVLGQASFALLRFALTGQRRAFLNWTAARLLFVFMGVILTIAVLVDVFLGGSINTATLALGGAEIFVPMLTYLFGRKSKPRV